MNIILKVHTLFFLFFFFFAYYVVVLLTVYWKADLALFRRPDLEKDKNKEQMSVRLKIIIVRAVTQSWNFADFDLYISAGMGFQQWKIIMPLIPISCSSASCCRCFLCCAKRCSFFSAVSCWHLLCCSCWVWSWRSHSRGVSVENLPGRGFGATCCACVSFAWEIVRDSPIVNFDSQTMNKHIKLVIGGEVYVAWKCKMHYDVIGGHQAYIQRKRDLFTYEASTCRSTVQASSIAFFS